jgi:(2Fe-2S) ferredoxin
LAPVGAGCVDFEACIVVCLDGAWIRFNKAQQIGSLLQRFFDRDASAEREASKTTPAEKHDRRTSSRNTQILPTTST